MNTNLIEVGYYEEVKNGERYPYWTWIDLDDDEFPIAVAEGRGFSGVGCSLMAEEIRAALRSSVVKNSECSSAPICA